MTLIRSENEKKTKKNNTAVSQCFSDNNVELLTRFAIPLYPKVSYKIAVVIAYTYSALEGNKDTQVVEGNRIAKCIRALFGSCIKTFCIVEKKRITNRERPI